MIAGQDMDSVTHDLSSQRHAIMAELSASAFDINPPVKVHQEYVFQVLGQDLQGESVTLPNLSVHVPDTGHALAQELGEKAKRAQAANLHAYRVRIEALRAEARQDGYDLNTASDRNFWRFIDSRPFIRKGNLVLLDNGNFRAVWKGEDGNHIGLQFLRGDIVQYVIFRRRAAAEAISRVAGRDNIDGVKRQIAAFDLQPLIYA